MDVGAVSQGISAIQVMQIFNARYKGWFEKCYDDDITAMTTMPMALLVEEVIVFSAHCITPQE